MILMTVAIVTALSLLMELVAFRPVRRASPVVLLITSFAVAYMLEALGWTDILGASPVPIGTGEQKGVEPYPWLNANVGGENGISGVLISHLTIVIWVVTIVLVVGMTLLLKKTTLGIQLRASTEDFRMAQLVGVRANWVISAAFGITGLLASAVAILYVLRIGPAIDPNVGQGPLLIAFVGGVIGGLGSLVGAALGGFVLGAIINVLQAELPATGAHPLNNHTLVFAFMAVIAILVFQPNGLVALRGPIVAGWRRLRPKPIAAEVARP
jgi:branched-chain amino acid transport system permease protein